jgi:hypothetical protein
VIGDVIVVIIRQMRRSCGDALTIIRFPTETYQTLKWPTLIPINFSASAGADPAEAPRLPCLDHVKDAGRSASMPKPHDRPPSAAGDVASDRPSIDAAGDAAAYVAELTEALTAIGCYTGAMGRLLRSESTAATEKRAQALDRCTAQVARANHAVRQLYKLIGRKEP